MPTPVEQHIARMEWAAAYGIAERSAALDGDWGKIVRHNVPEEDGKAAAPAAQGSVSIHDLGQWLATWVADNV